MLSAFDRSMIKVLSSRRALSVSAPLWPFPCREAAVRFRGVFHISTNLRPPITGLVVR